MEVEENATIGAGLLPSVRHYENPRRHRRAISDITHHPSVSVSVPMFPHLPLCCQHHQQQQQQLTWGYAQVPTGRKSPSRFIVSLQRPAPVAVACSQPSLWCQQPGRTLNEPMSHQPGISQQSATSNQRASNQPSKPALLPHKGPRPSGPSELSDTLWPGTSNLPTAVAAREARLAVRAISITESSSLLGRERAVVGLPANHQHTTRTSSAFSGSRCRSQVIAATANISLR